MNKVNCHDCGLSYSKFGLDFVLPDQQWKVIFPEQNGLLCANCICRRAANNSAATVVLGWVDSLLHPN